MKSSAIVIFLSIACGTGVLAGTALTAEPGTARASVAAATAPAQADKRRCRFVKKRVRGKVRRVRVCRQVKPAAPAPRPPAPPLPAGARVTATVTLAVAPGQVAVGEGAVWVKGVPASVTRVDPVAAAVAATVPIGAGEFGYVTLGFGSVWATNNDANTVSRIDPGTNAAVATIPVRENPQGITAGFGSVWVVNHRDDSLSRIDPVTNSVIATIDDPRLCCNPQAITVAAGSVWVGLAGRDQVARIDPATNAIVALVPVVGACGRFAYAGDALWLTACDGFEINRIDVVTNTSRPVALGERAFGIAAYGGSLWAVLPSTGRVARLDPATGSTVGRLPLPGAFFADGGAEGLWVTTTTGSLVRLEPTG